AGFCERSSELGATVEGVSAFACLDFHELTDDLESLRGPETRKGLTLCFQAEARTPLPDSGHSVVRDDWPCHDSLEPLSRCAPVLGLRSLQLPCPRALVSRGAPRLRVSGLYSPPLAPTADGRMSDHEWNRLDTCRTQSFCPNLRRSRRGGWKYLPGPAGAARGPRSRKRGSSPKATLVARRFPRLHAGTGSCRST